MSQPQKPSRAPWLWPLRILAWPFVVCAKAAYEHWLSYVLGHVKRSERRVFSVRFVWYGDSVYLHPMIWGSLVLYFVARSEVVAAGWPLLAWFILLAVCFLTIIYNFDIIKTGVLLACLVAVLSLAYISNIEWEWNVFQHLANHVRGLDVSVSPGFYIISCYVFSILICAELITAWLFHRVELDESYVYERKFLQGSSREPVFARGLKRETKDLLELLILGAGDIQHRTKTGVRRFPNVPGASLGLGRAIDSMLDYRRNDEIDLQRKTHDDADQAMLSDAMPDLAEQTDNDGIHPDGNDENA